MSDKHKDAPGEISVESALKQIIDADDAQALTQHLIDIGRTALARRASQVSAAAPADDYRVGWFWSSANPDKQVRCLAEGKEIAEYEKRSDFIRWCASEGQAQTSAATWITEAVRIFGSARLTMNWPDVESMLKNMEESGKVLAAQLANSTGGVKS